MEKDAEVKPENKKKNALRYFSIFVVSETMAV
jgi:hypothetical protein